LTCSGLATQTANSVTRLEKEWILILSTLQDCKLKIPT
jgi:hypothetical protein